MPGPQRGLARRREGVQPPDVLDREQRARIGGGERPLLGDPGRRGRQIARREVGSRAGARPSRGRGRAGRPACARVSGRPGDREAAVQLVAPQPGRFAGNRRPGRRAANRLDRRADVHETRNYSSRGQCLREDPLSVAENPPMASPYLEALARRVLVFDGALGTEFMARELDDAAFGGAAYHGCNEALVLSSPASDRGFTSRTSPSAATCSRPTRSWPRASSSTNTASASEDRDQLGRRAARARSGRSLRDARAPAFRRGRPRPDGDAHLFLRSVALEDHLRRTGGAVSRTIRRADRGRRRPAADRDQSRSARDEGRDRGHHARVRRRRAARPIQAQATLDVTGRMLLGTDIAAVTATLDALPIDVIGLNCSTGPPTCAMRSAIS